MLLATLLTMSQLSLPLFPALGQEDSQARLNDCLTLAASDPAKAEASANQWTTAGGGYLAHQCLGVAYTNEQRWSTAAGAFEDAGREADSAHDPRAADLWAQAGNAWLAAGEYAKARAALDTALVAGTLTGQPLGEAYLDRARARFAGGDLDGARADLDLATVNAPADPLVWLLSARLARQMDDLARAQKDIAEALQRSPDDASVQLEAGYIAGWAGDFATAHAAFVRVTEIAPGSPRADAARAALAKLAPVEH